MSRQQTLFGADNLATSVQMPAAPKLTPHHNWPYPGMTPVASAQASMASTEAYQAMLAAVIKARGSARSTAREVLAAVPKDWRDLCGKYTHATLANWAAKDYGIEIIYVPHDDGGLHFEYRAEGGAA